MIPEWTDEAETEFFVTADSREAAADAAYHATADVPFCIKGYWLERVDGNRWKATLEYA